MFHRLAAPAIFAVAAALLLSGRAGAPAPAAGDLPVAAPTPVPAIQPPPAPAQALEQARQQAFVGDWDAALASYALAAAGAGAIGETARFETARLLELMDRPADGVAALAPLLMQPSGGESWVRAWFLQGTLQNELGNTAESAVAYARAIELGGPAVAYARINRARALAAADPDGALTTLAPMLDGTVPAPVLARRRGLVLALQLESDGGHWDRALAHAAALQAAAGADAEKVAALAGLGTARAALGDTGGAVEAFTALVSGYPGTAAAESALASLEALGRPASPLLAGIVHYRRRNNQLARDVLNAYVRDNGSTGPGAAAALFFLGALADRRDDTVLAVENYAEAYAADPTGSYAGEALWERARTLEGAGRVVEAREEYARLPALLPGSRHAADAAFRAGYLAFANGDGAAARAIWSAAAAAATTAANAARAALWTGRAATAQADAAAARLSYTEAVRRDSTGYEGLRAGALLAGEPSAPATAVRSGRLDLPAPDWVAAERWLASWAGPEDAGAWTSLSTSEDWRAGREMMALGWTTTGTEALGALIDERQGQPWVLYRAARALADAGYPHLGVEAAGLLFAGAPAGSRTVPEAVSLMRLAYPAPWADQMRRSSAASSIDPLLLLAVIRQESLFNPVAGSTAGAFGLTQVIPGTAADIAHALGQDDTAFGDLARPSLAIQFGAYYLGAQLRAFGGNIYEALAAYNGGAGNAARWERAAGGPGDVDRFFEEIDYTETRAYLRLVMQNYAWYRYLYGAASRPSLTAAGS